MYTMSAVIKTQMPSLFKNKKVRDQCAPYHHAQCSSCSYLWLTLLNQHF